MRRILGALRRADEDFSMIDEGDKICVAVSGGKDSMLLLKALRTYQYFSKNKFEMYAVSIDLGFENMNFEELERFCKEIDVPLIIKKTQISQIVFDIRKETNPCSLCAKMKRGALNDVVLELGSNKLALGHHRDDFIESFLLSMFYEGRLHTFKPVTYLDRKKVYAIRPLIYAREKDIVGVVRKENIPVIKSKCPVDGYTKREEVKEILKNLKKQIPDVDERMFSAIKNSLDKF